MHCFTVCANTAILYLIHSSAHLTPNIHIYAFIKYVYLPGTVYVWHSFPVFIRTVCVIPTHSPIVISLRSETDYGRTAPHFCAAAEKRTRQKAIVFSQFWMHIKLAARHLAAHGVVFCALRGGMTPYEKAASLNRFQKDPQVRRPPRLCAALCYPITKSVS
jgi:SNF2 family DNA or RNA helicase